MCWRVRTGSPWRDLPERLGAWQTAWARFDRWSNDGTLTLILAAVQQDADQDGAVGWDVSADSTIVRAHRHSAGARTPDPHDTGGPDELHESASRAA